MPAYEPEDLPEAIMEAMKRQRLEGGGWKTACWGWWRERLSNW